MLRELTSRKSLTLYPNCLCEKTSSPNYRGSTVARDNRAAKRYSLAVGVCIGYSIGNCLFPFLEEERSKRESQSSVRSREKEQQKRDHKSEYRK